MKGKTADEDKFLVGKTLFKATQSGGSGALTPVAFRGKAICIPPDPVVKERVYLDFFGQLHQEHASPECRVAQGYLVGADSSSGVCTYLVKVTAVRGKFGRRYGFSHREVQYLYPEEAFYLSECGRLQVYDGGLSLSLQQLCNAVFRSAFEFSCYTAYAWLARQGFVLRRREATDTVATNPFAKEVEPEFINVLMNPSPMGDASKEAERQYDDDTDADFLMASPSNLTPVGETGLNEWVLHDRSPCSGGNKASADTTSAPAVVFNVFSDRTVKFTKGRPTEPDFVFVVVSLEDGVRFLPNRQFRRSFGLSPGTKTILAKVDNGDVYLQCAHPFSIPTINQI
ncbi:tRNA-splicing endonuclease subunit Sen54 [Echinococcus granulosus]|nr:tRNA-splicing endonuclease subunit Sen54 [Echinococcus granulosus]